ncbi:MAG: ATP-dependent Clp protease ATP-binding subunit [Clostridia bacterium]|nr:ATP-dependent Clp protease ATP-binding subunit [Clostridia bacterium]
MNFKKCCRCHKRMASVYVSRLENGVMKNEGYCLICAKELGMKPVEEMLSQLGMQEDELDEALAGCEDALAEMGDGADMPDMTAVVKSESEDKNEPAPQNGQGFPFDSSFFPNLFANIIRAGGGDEKREKSDERPQNKKSKYKFLPMFASNLTEKAVNGKLDRIIGRDNELERVIQILCRRQKNNPCLIGEPGVGKTAIAEALAQRIADGNVPYALREKEVFQLDLPSMIAGTQYRGQFEKRFTGLISEIKDHGNAILVIDEVHNIIGAGGNSEGSMDAANMIKPALSRGEIQVIGATTLDEYRRYIEKDGALERRFQPVMVNEPSIEDSIKMLANIKKYYENYHGVHLSDNIIARAVELSERYITDRFLPDKAIDLIDEALSYKAIHSDCISEKKKADSEMALLGEEKSKAEALPDDNEEKYKLLADIKVRELQLLDKLQKLEADCAALALDTADLARVIEVWTGVPATSITQNEFERLTTLEEKLSKRVVGQDEAIKSVCRAIRRKRAGVSYAKKPVSFLFAGPTGVGKTELVKALADELFHTPDNIIRIDMSEYADRWNTSKFTGSAPGYVGYDEGGQLTEKVRRHPYSIVLFDEIDKAHPDVLDILLQVLDDGRMTDGKGRTVNFENTVIIMTTNAGSGKSSSVAGFSTTTNEQVKERVDKAISKFLKPEFVNRIDETVIFNALTRENFVGIAEKMLGELSLSLESSGIRMRYTPEVKRKVAEESYSEKFGARNMRRYIQSKIEDEIADKIIANYKTGVTDVSISVKNGEFSVAVI